MYPGCEKSYGSDNTLSQHIKIKHPEFWKQLKESKERIFRGENISGDTEGAAKKDNDDAAKDKNVSKEE